MSRGGRAAPRARGSPRGVAVLEVALVGVGDAGGLFVDGELEVLPRVRDGGEALADVAAAAALAGAENVHVGVEHLLGVEPLPRLVEQRLGFFRERPARLARAREPRVAVAQAGEQRDAADQQNQAAAGDELARRTR